jgi:hypothetical protein
MKDLKTGKITPPPSHEEYTQEIQERREKELGGGVATEDLESLHVDQLKDRARDANVENFSTMRKDELVKAIKKAEKSGGAGGGG